MFRKKLLPYIICDRRFIKEQWKLTMDYPLDLRNPRSFNEKLNWLKLNDRRPEYSMMVDKYLVKDYVAGIIGKEYIIPTLGVWDRPEDVDFDALPQRFVLKCNHNSGLGMVICRDKSSLDREAALEGLRKGLAQNYYRCQREWPYKNVRRRIIAEEYLEDDASGSLPDYKFFCFDGEVMALFIATGREKGEEATRFDFFDAEFRHLPFTNGHPNADVTPSRPECFEEMKSLAAKLSAGLPCVRVDLYQCNGKVYFGELTFSHWAGFKPFVPREWDYTFGSWIKLPEK